LEEQKYNKLRLVEINTYYGKQYNTHTKIMQTIVLMCIPIFILSILANNGIIPPTVYGFITGIIIIIGVIMLGAQIIDLSNRDNMNWDEYNWEFDKSKAPVYVPNTDGSETNSDPWSTPSLTCIGSDCCYIGSTYDSVQNICVPTTTGTTTGSTTTDSTTTGSTTTGSTTTDSTTTGSTTTDSTTTGSTTTESFKGLGKYGYFSVKQ
jgi:hypothetical protein